MYINYQIFQAKLPQNLTSEWYSKEEEHLVKNFFNLQIHNLFEQLYLNLVTLTRKVLCDSICMIPSFTYLTASILLFGLWHHCYISCKSLITSKWSWKAIKIQHAHPWNHSEKKHTKNAGPFQHTFYFTFIYMYFN